MSHPDPNEVWTIQRILAWTQRFFGEKGISSARLDAELLLAAILGVNRVHLYTHFDQPLQIEERDAYRAAVKRRAGREPLAHILGGREFYGRLFKVSRDVLTPRPETEHLIDAALEWAKAKAPPSLRVLDLGTGSGIIAITLALELPDAQVIATDLSTAALDVARENAASLGASERIEWRNGDLFAPVESEAPFDIIAANLPYVDPATRAELEPEVREYEPAMALFAEDHGLALIRRLCANAGHHLTANGLLVFEIGFDQEAASRAALDAVGGFSSPQVVRDYQGHPRVVVAERGPT